jgi:hypothetical protein
MANSDLISNCRVFQLAKHAGDSPYEDASACDISKGRFAVADGASESSFAGSWARLLVDEFIATDADPICTWPAWLTPLQQRWEMDVSTGPLPWYAETKLEQGAFATFLGVVVDRPRWWRRKRWRAVAVGDSCLFQIRAGRLRRSFPVESATAFDNNPWLVSSRPSRAGDRPTNELHARGDCRAGDSLWLMTDALAHWFLRCAENGEKPWEGLTERLTPDNAQSIFAAWAAERRDALELKNDDVTLISLLL